MKGTNEPCTHEAKELIALVGFDRALIRYWIEVSLEDGEDRGKYVPTREGRRTLLQQTVRATQLRMAKAEAGALLQRNRAAQGGGG